MHFRTFNLGTQLYGFKEPRAASRALCSWRSSPPTRGFLTGIWVAVLSQWRMSGAMPRRLWLFAPGFLGAS